MRPVLSTLLALFCAVADVTAQVRLSMLTPWAEALGYAPAELYRIRIGDFGYPFSNVEINGKSFELPFDTGNMTGLSLTAELIGQLNLPLIGEWTSLDSNGRVVGRYRTHQAAEVRAFGRTSTGDSIFELAHPALPGLVGPQHLRGRRFTVDYGNGVMGVSSQPFRRAPASGCRWCLPAVTAAAPRARSCPGRDALLRSTREKPLHHRSAVGPGAESERR
jgi:hypothetical protein